MAELELGMDPHQAALREWKEKLELLLVEEARETDTARLFKLGKEIAEARSKIAELEGTSLPAAQQIAPSRLSRSSTRSRASSTASC